MILTIFIIPVALGADTELQILAVLFCPPANGTFMGVCALFSLFYILHIGASAADLLGRITMHTPHSKEKENKIPQRQKGHQAISRMYDDSDL